MAITNPTISTGRSATGGMLRKIGLGRKDFAGEMRPAAQPTSPFRELLRTSLISPLPPGTQRIVGSQPEPDIIGPAGRAAIPSSGMPANAPMGQAAGFSGETAGPYTPPADFGNQGQSNVSPVQEQASRNQAPVPTPVPTPAPRTAAVRQVQSTTSPYSNQMYSQMRSVPLNAPQSSSMGRNIVEVPTQSNLAQKPMPTPAPPRNPAPTYAPQPGGPQLPAQQFRGGFPTPTPSPTGKPVPNNWDTRLWAWNRFLNPNLA